MKKIYENLYQFTTYIPPMDFTIHQYLLASDPAIVFATGTQKEAAENLATIKEILGEHTVRYIFVSHMESDECGGLPIFTKEYPEATVLCSALCAREFPGYGFTGKIKVCNENEILEDGTLKLHFFNYPSEVHLQNGLVCYEENSGVFYSADLMLRSGNGTGKLIDSNWKTEVADIKPQYISSEDIFSKLKEKLLTITPKLIAVGHGFCITLK